MWRIHVSKVPVKCLYSSFPTCLWTFQLLLRSEPSLQGELLLFPHFLSHSLQFNNVSAYWFRQLCLSQEPQAQAGWNDSSPYPIIQQNFWASNCSRWHLHVCSHRDSESPSHFCLPFPFFLYSRVSSTSALLAFWAWKFFVQRGRLELFCAFYNVWQYPQPLPTSCQ